MNELDIEPSFLLPALLFTICLSQGIQHCSMCSAVLESFLNADLLDTETACDNGAYLKLGEGPVKAEH